jgi:hypothetical protein
MKWQFLLLAGVLVAVVAMVWRSSGKKSGCGCKGGCSHQPDADAGEEKAAR